MNLKKAGRTSVKILLFLGLWALLAALLPVPDVQNPALWRFFAELIPLLSTVVLTLVFYRHEKLRISYFLLHNKERGLFLGLVTGLIWLLLPLLLLFFFNQMTFTGVHEIEWLGLWFLSAFLNTVMQEFLIRGYIYQLLWDRYNPLAAIIITSIIFLLLHGGAIEAGLVPALNVLTMSFLMSALLEYTESIWAPVTAHFIWNAFGALIFGAVELAADYPQLLETRFAEKKLICCPDLKLEGSVIVLLMNIFLTAWIVFFYRREKRAKASHETKGKEAVAK